MRRTGKPAALARTARPTARAGKAATAPARKRAMKAAAPAAAPTTAPTTAPTATPSALPADSMRAAVTNLKRERIVAAAADLFYADGFVNTTLDAVAQRLHVTKPFIYAHFGSKRELLGVICAHGIRASLDALDHVLMTDAPATEKLSALMHGFMSAVLDNQKNIGIYTREEKHLDAQERKTIEDLRREFDRKLCALLDAGVASGEFDIPDTKMASLAIGGMASWAYVWFRPGGRLSVSQIAAHMAALVGAMSQPGSPRNQRNVRNVRKTAKK